MTSFSMQLVIALAGESFPLSCLDHDAGLLGLHERSGVRYLVQLELLLATFTLDSSSWSTQLAYAFYLSPAALALCSRYSC